MRQKAVAPARVAALTALEAQDAACRAAAGAAAATLRPPLPRPRRGQVPPEAARQKAEAARPRQKVEAARPRLRPPLPQPRRGQVPPEADAEADAKQAAEVTAEAVAHNRPLQPLPRRKLVAANPSVGHALVDPEGMKSRDTPRGKDRKRTNAP